MEKHAFISYSREDQPYVERLTEWLKTTGVPVWLDNDIDYGDTWTQTIEKHLDTADAIIVVMSTSAKESIWVSREIARAERKQKQIFPLLLSGEPLLQFETTQYEDVTDGSLPSPKFADSVASTLGITLRGLGSDLINVIERYRESGVLILGRFTQEQRPVLEMIRDSLRQRGFIPVLFDFALPQHLNLHDTLLLFSLAVRFIIADLTGPKSIPHELAMILPVAHVPVRPIIKQGNQPYAMFADLMDYPWIIDPLIYKNEKELMANIDSQVIQVAEDKYQELHSKNGLYQHRDT